MILGNNVQERWLLYKYNNARFDGEIWLAFMTPNGLRLSPIDGKFPEDGVLLGEVHTRIAGNTFVHTAKPLRERSAEEMRRRARATERHKARRAEMWTRYSF